MQQAEQEQYLFRCGIETVERRLARILLLLYVLFFSSDLLSL